LLRTQWSACISRQVGVVAIPKETPIKVRVQCYAGHRGEEEPRAFYLGDQRADIMEIIDRWLSPCRRHFRVQAYDGSVYILHHDEAAGEWELT
jgi:phage-related protein